MYFILKVTINCLYVTRTFSQVNSKSMLKGNQNYLLPHLQIKMSPLNTNGRNWVSSSVPGQHPVWFQCKKRVSVHKKVSLIVFSRLTAPQRPPTYCTIWGLSGSWRLLISWRNAFSPCLQRHLPPFALCVLCLHFPPPLTCTESSQRLMLSNKKKKTKLEKKKQTWYCIRVKRDLERPADQVNRAGMEEWHRQPRRHDILITKGVCLRSMWIRPNN